MYLFPKHVCPTVNLAEMALFVTGGGAVDRPREYSLVPVDARAHDIAETRRPRLGSVRKCRSVACFGKSQERISAQVLEQGLCTRAVSVPSSNE